MILYVAAVMVGLGLATFSVALAAARREQAASAHIEQDAPGSAQPFVYRALEPVLDAAGRMTRRLSPVGRQGLIARRITYAGLEGVVSPDRIMSYKAVCAVLFGAVGFVGAPGSIPPLMWGLAIGAAASFAPDLLLDSRARTRQGQIARDLPEALDLMAITVEAGLGLEQALSLVTEKLEGPLGAECNRMLREIELGVPRHRALQDLRVRTDVPELSAFVAALIQADQVGAPIADVLRVQAAQVRLKRRQRARERAAQTPVKILFPVIFCIFPALFVVTIGPGAINIMRTLFQI
ncbi:MAG TPA: type II secretion system F family protein [Actinomycetota bacterium]|nr:type II secretion system F family protein [Actinomycetota bacterium]